MLCMNDLQCAITSGLGPSRCLFSLGVSYMPSAIYCLDVTILFIFVSVCEKGSVHCYRNGGHEPEFDLVRFSRWVGLLCARPQPASCPTDPRLSTWEQRCSLLHQSAVRQSVCPSVCLWVCMLKSVRCESGLTMVVYKNIDLAKLMNIWKLMLASKLHRY